jgi:hypothetical protein
LAVSSGLFVQEVNAVSLAVEKFYPKTLAVIELGDRMRKLLYLKTLKPQAKRKKDPSMNDKCRRHWGGY